MSVRLLTSIVAAAGCGFTYASALADGAGTPDAAQRQATVAFLTKARQGSGGYAEVKSAASLPTTRAAVTALRYFGGAVSDGKACARFVLSCRDPNAALFSPSFASTPGGKPDAASTALAALTLLELRGAGRGGATTRTTTWGSFTLRTTAAADVADDDVWDALNYSLTLVGSAKSPDEFRRFGDVIEVASRCGSIRVPPAGLLLGDLKDRANPDGTYGKGDGAVADTADAVVAFRGAGAAFVKAEAVGEFLKKAQRPDGGWGAAKSDLETTARVVHALALLELMPDAARCRRFVAACRKEDGSYGLHPGEAGTVRATHLAGAVLHRLVTVAGEK